MVAFAPGGDVCTGGRRNQGSLLRPQFNRTSGLVRSVRACILCRLEYDSLFGKKILRFVLREDLEKERQKTRVTGLSLALLVRCVPVVLSEKVLPSRPFGKVIRAAFWSKNLHTIVNR